MKELGLYSDGCFQDGPEQSGPFTFVHVENKVFQCKQCGRKSSLRCRKEVLGQKASCLELRRVFWNFSLVEFSAEFGSLTFKNAFSQLVSRFGDCSCAPSET